MSASVEDEHGVARRLFVCRHCVSELSGAWQALARDAENHERHGREELERAARRTRRFVGRSGVAA
jgi:hypothetical protein